MADEVITGVFSAYRARKNDWAVGLLTDRTIICGEFAEQLLVGHDYEFWGYRQKNEKFGDQFKVKAWKQRGIASSHGVQEYLKKHCHGIGPVGSDELWLKYGPEAVRILRTDPERVAREVKRIRLPVAQAAAAELRIIAKFEDVKIALTDVLAGRGFSSKLPDDCIREWKLHAADVIRRDPWKLLVKGFSSCGFNRCMRLYSDLGLPMNRLKVQTIACWYALHSDNSGSTWHPRQKAIDMLCASMGAGVKLRPDKALRLGIRARWLSIKKDANGDTWIAEHEKAMDEWRLAQKLKAMRACDEGAWLDCDSITGITEHQRAAAKVASSSNVGILGGPPGCLHGDTKIFDPTDGTSHTVRQRCISAKGFSVFSATASGFVIASACAPIRYSPQVIVKVSFSSGRSVSVTLGHRFLTSHGYVSSLQISDFLRSGERVHLPSISEFDLQAHRLNARHLKRTGPDSRERCSACFCQCDERLLFEEGSDRSPLPSQDDAQGRASLFCRPCLDARVHKYEHSRPCQCSDRPSSMDCIDRSVILPGFVCEHQLHEGFAEHSVCLRRPLSQLDLAASPQNRDQQPSRCDASANAEPVGTLSCGRATPCDTPALNLTPLKLSSVEHDKVWKEIGAFLRPCIDGEVLGWKFSSDALVDFESTPNYSRWDQIVNVEIVREEEYFDFHVPYYENYVAGGHIHHNSGKSYTLAAMLKAALKKFDASEIAVCSPTGKASVRIAQALLDNGVNDISATTIHRLLKPTRNGHDGKAWGFHHGKDMRLPHRLCVIEEMSMLDTGLAADFFEAVRDDAIVMCVADVNQLPPVSHGKPLLDMIESNYPMGMLAEIHRNAGDIVRCSQECKAGKPFTPSTGSNWKAGENVWIYQRASQGQQLAALKAVYENAPEQFDRFRGMVTLSVTNESSDVARKNINLTLQSMLNPNGAKVGNTPFRIGDRAICLENGDATEIGCLACGPLGIDSVREFHGDFACLRCGSIIKKNEMEEGFLANGEMGTVLDSGGDGLHILFDYPKRAIRFVGEHHTRCDIGYCISTHRAQGSSFPLVVLMADDSVGAAMVSSRQLVLTAISRAEKLAIVIGKKSTVDSWIQVDSISNRKTFLREALK